MSSREPSPAPCARAVLIAALMLSGGAVFAQDALAPALPSPLGPGLPAPPAGVGPLLPPPVGATVTSTLSVSASLAGEARPIGSGLHWRVYGERPDGSLNLVAQSRAASASFALPPATYFVHASYGLAGATRRVVLRPSGATERLSIAAGGLRLSGTVGGAPIPPGRANFSVFIPIGSNSEGRLVAQNLRAGEVLRLPEGSYHVVSNYGNTNAIQRADLRVEAGRLLDATITHRAATVTMKLVDRPGGEAIAATNFTVLTPGGDVIREVIGAFPSLVLAEGTYTLIARNDGRVFPARDFEVRSGQDSDVEVLAR